MKWPPAVNAAVHADLSRIGVALRDTLKYRDDSAPHATGDMRPGPGGGDVWIRENAPADHTLYLQLADSRRVRAKWDVELERA